MVMWQHMFSMPVMRTKHMLQLPANRTHNPQLRTIPTT